MGRTFAAADIGSNTLHLLIAEANGSAVRRLRTAIEWLGLGEIVGREGAIPAPVADTLIATLASFRQAAQSAKAQGIYVFATEAMRSAANQQKIVQRAKKEAGLEVEVISPRREAELSYRGTALDTPVASTVALIEVGGGSAQVARCKGREVLEAVSLPLGTGKLIAQTFLGQPCTEEQLDMLYHLIDESAVWAGSVAPVGRVIGSGGVLRGIWRALHPDGARLLAVEELDYIAWSAARLTIDQVTRRFDVKPKRAATLVPGALVVKALLRQLGHSVVTVSEFGVREGAILEMAEGKVELCRV
jgi:exopolyphosphatase/guanosine-5'-triphosphate,3'-diphosphate pyrophosphatase